MTTFIAWLFWLLGCIGFSCITHLLAGAGRPGAAVAIVISLIALVVPFGIHDAPLLRAAVALYLLWSCFKVIDLVRARPARSAGFRLLQALVIYDLNRDSVLETGARPALKLGLIATSAGAAAAATAMLHLALFWAPRLDAPFADGLRHLAGMAFAYLGIEAMLRMFEFVYRAAGLGPPVLHDHPILSRSLAEFWGRRWNRVVGGWLFATCYRPLAIRGRRVLGVLAAFVASAALHFYFTWAAVGVRWAACMALFFLLQAPLLLLERRWNQQGWPDPWRRVWTVSLLLVTSPLFIEPLLAIMRGGFTGDALALLALPLDSKASSF